MSGSGAREALAELVQGELSLDPDEGDGLYSQVFAVLCSAYGGWLRDDRLNWCNADWLTRPVALSGGVPLRLSALVSGRGGVVTDAAIDQRLDVGFWTAEEVSAARPALEALIRSRRAVPWRVP